MKPAARAPSVDAIETAAADWLARRDAGFPPAEEAAFAAWCAADPRHAAAVAALGSAWSLLARPRAAGQAEAVWHELTARTARRRHHAVASAAGLGLAAALAFAVFSPSARVAAPGPPEATAAATVTVRPEVRLLADGSTVELNADADLAVEFSPGERRVRLLRGEALFAVAKDPARPFVVHAGSVQVRAVGTEFSVGIAPASVAVLVTEGRVAVDRTAVGGAGARDSARVFVSDGGRVTVPTDDRPAAPPAVEPVDAAAIARALAWRQHRVEFTGTPLADAVALFNRRNRGQLALADPALGELRISGVFWTDDPEGFARLLEAGFRLRTRTRPDGTLEVSR